MSEKEAAKAIEAYFESWNGHDGEANRNALHFPHVRINDAGNVNIIQKEDEYVPLERVLSYLAENEGWDRSSLDTMEVIHASDVKVHFKIEFSRYKADGSKYAVHKSLWIVTKRDERWGVQARSSYAS